MCVRNNKVTISLSLVLLTHSLTSSLAYYLNQKWPTLCAADKLPPVDLTSQVECERRFILAKGGNKVYCSALKEPVSALVT